MVAIVLGVLLLIFLLADVFGTVFHAQGVGGPLNRVQCRLIWTGFRAFGKRGDGSTRDSFLAFAAPTMIVITLLAWFVLLTVAFALIYLPHISDFDFSSGVQRPPWVEVLYYSGYTAATLGLGDMIPDTAALRLLTPLQAFSGFALVSVSVTYLLATYSALILSRTCAVNIHSYLEANELGSTGFLAMDGYEVMANWAQDAAVNVLRTLQSHFQYPVLHYFRPTDSSTSLPVQLDRFRTLRKTESDRGGEEGENVMRDHPSFRFFSQAMDEYISNVAEHFVPAGGEGGEASEDPMEAAAQHDRLLRYMLYR